VYNLWAAVTARSLQCVIDQYPVSTHKRSGITSDPNGYSVDLIERVVRVSVETVGIVRELQKLPFRTADE
jgi:predicted helicase